MPTTSRPGNRSDNTPNARRSAGSFNGGTITTPTALFDPWHLYSLGLSTDDAAGGRGAGGEAAARGATLTPPACRVVGRPTTGGSNFTQISSGGACGMLRHTG
ncbi:MAG TPA: hypothetical protein VD866_01895 [Urbifossiella sp.]|nr:hypothetical protein [Urbifossiella sp.]